MDGSVGMHGRAGAAGARSLTGRCRARRSERYDLTEESLERQYQRVRRRTSNNDTFAMGSHVMQYGARAIDKEPAADYLGALNTGAPQESGPRAGQGRCLRSLFAVTRGTLAVGTHRQRGTVVLPGAADECGGATGALLQRSAAAAAGRAAPAMPCLRSARKAEHGAQRAGDGSAGNPLLHADEDGAGAGALPQREADLLPLRLGVQRAAPGAARVAARAELAAALDARRVRMPAAQSSALRGPWRAYHQACAVGACTQASFSHLAVRRVAGDLAFHAVSCKALGGAWHLRFEAGGAQAVDEAARGAVAALLAQPTVLATLQARCQGAPVTHCLTPPRPCTAA